MDFREFVRVLIRQTPILVLVSAVAAAIVVAYTWNQPQRFVSYAVINTGVITSDAVEIGDEGRLDRIALASQVKSMKEMLESRRVISEATVRVLRERLLRGDVPDFIRKAPAGSTLGERRSHARHTRLIS